MSIAHLHFWTCHSKMRSVLIITYSWPPDASVGAVRSTKLAKHLSRQGWSPIIVTVKEHYYEQKFIMKSACGEPSEPLVIRTRRLRNPRDLYLFVKRTIWQLLGCERQFKESVLRGTVKNVAEA